MRKLMLSLILLGSVSAMAHEWPLPQKIIEFWDDTFAYNKLTVETVPMAPHLIRMTLSGGQIGVGNQMEGLKGMWGNNDRVIMTLKKDDCIIDEVAGTLDCDHSEKMSARITWDVSPVMTKTLTILIFNVKASGDSNGASMSFEVAPSEHFTPSVPVPTFEIKNFTKEPTISK